MVHFVIAEVRTGQSKPFGPDGRLSAIDKQPAAGPVFATATGLASDEQADCRHHGGIDKAIHAYSACHYAAWAASLPAAGERFRPGGFGENLVIEGATEADICLGDRWRAGDVLLEVSQGRQPCWKLNVRFGVPDMAQRVQASGWSGWYFRVAEPGRMAAGSRSCLEARPHPEWPLTRVTDLLYRNRLDREALAAFAVLPGLPESWRRLAERRLDSGRVEDWETRLRTPG